MEFDTNHNQNQKKVMNANFKSNNKNINNNTKNLNNSKTFIQNKTQTEFLKKTRKQMHN